MIQVVSIINLNCKLWKSYINKLFLHNAHVTLTVLDWRTYHGNPQRLVNGVGKMHLLMLDPSVQIVSLGTQLRKDNGLQVIRWQLKRETQYMLDNLHCLSVT